MPEWLLITLGVLAGLAIIIGVVFVVITPVAFKRKRSRIAPRSGQSNEQGWSSNTGGWASGD